MVVDSSFHIPFLRSCNIRLLILVVQDGGEIHD